VIVVRTHLKTAAVLAFSTACILLPAASASAQQGWPYAGENWDTRRSSYSGGYRNGGGYLSGSYNPAPEYPAPVYSPSVAAYYYPLGQIVGVTNAAPPSNARVALINVQVPASATVWFDQSPTSQTGDFRRFVSPLLQTGADYHYRIKVRWQENGQDVTSTRDVAIHAGDQVNLTFGPAAIAAARR
jgi:uncharacterized protein (TIGR03000 family)